MSTKLAKTWKTDMPVKDVPPTTVKLPQEQPAQNSCKDWIDFNIEQDSAPDAPELIDGILRQGEKMVLAGSSKSNKTWSLLDLAISIASGSAWWDKETTRAVVVYVDMELPKKQLQRRIHAILKVRGITLERGQLNILSLRGQVASARETLRQIHRACPKGTGLIILDPIYKFNAGRDENSAGDISELMNHLEELAVETGASVAYAAHYSKGNQSQKNAIDRIAGSGVYGRDADTMVMVTRHEEKDCFSVDVILRNFAPVEPWVVRWTFPRMEREEALDPAKLKRSKPHNDGAAEKNATRALRSLATPMRYTDWLKLAVADGINANTFKKYVKVLEATGKIVNDGRLWAKK